MQTSYMDAPLLSFNQLFRGNYIILSQNLSFVENFVKCSLGCLADALAALLPNEDTGISNFIVYKK